jgi:hypothetical protein
LTTAAGGVGVVAAGGVGGVGVVAAGGVGGVGSVGFEALGIVTPLSQTNFEPDLMQVNFLVPTI